MRFYNKEFNKAGGIKMNYFWEIQLNIFTLILLFIVLAHAIYRLDFKLFIDKMFIRINIMTILVVLLEASSVILNNFNEARFVNASRIVNMIGFILTPIVAALLLYTTITITRKNNKISRKDLLILGAPIIFNIILCSLSLKFGLIFSISSLNVYERGPLFFFTPIISYFYTILNVIVLLRCKNRFNRDQIYFFLLIILGPLIMGIIQIINYECLTIWNTTGIMVCLGYICILNNKLKIDTLTGIGNRLAFNDYVEKLNKKQMEKTCILSIDLNNFKKINDTYGHDEGDKALIYFAAVLRRVFYGVGKAIRIGGDEFIVFIDGSKDVDIKLFIRRIKNSINSKENPLKCKLSFSYGFVEGNSIDKDLNKAIKAADNLMYRDKKSNNNLN